MIDPKHFDREAAKRACRNDLTSVFPTEFAAIGHSVTATRRAGASVNLDAEATSVRMRSLWKMGMNQEERG